MIQSKQDLKDHIYSDNLTYMNWSKKQRIVSALAQYPIYALYRFSRYLRLQEYYINTAKGSKIRGFLGLYCEWRKNSIGNRLGIEIGPNCFGKGMTIYHVGSVIVNPAARIGENCRLHGANCIGNNGKDQGVPKIGNNVDIGYGAAVIGDIEIADDVIIGANAVVNRSVTVPGSVVAGVPARVIKQREQT